MTDQDILTQMQYALIETPDGGLTVESGLWTTDEFIDAINTAQLWVVREARPVLTRTTIATVPSQPRYQLPQTWIQTQRVTWETSDGTIVELPRDSSWSADSLDPDWTFELAQVPFVYTDFDTPVPALQVMPASWDTGWIGLTYIAEPTDLSNTGVSWTIPDILIPMAKWKALAILLAKDGRGQDLPRAARALQTAEEGMAAINTFMNGWR